MLKVLQTGILGVNTYIVPVAEGQDTVFLIDIGGSGGEVAAYLTNKGLIPCAVICTHGHFDHVMGLPEFMKNCPGVPLAVHRSDADCFGKAGAERHRETLSSLGADTAAFPDLENLPEPDILLPDGCSLQDICQGSACCAGTENWKILHTPGHTPGSVCVYNEKGSMLFSGDTLFYGAYGRTDLRGGNMRQMSESLRRLSLLPPETLVYPGHDLYGLPIQIPPL